MKNIVPKEHHISATTDGFDFSSVVPYKDNNLYEFKMSIGQQILIGGKGNKNGVAVTALYAGGITIGMLKPYYLDITNAISGASNQQTYAQFANRQHHRRPDHRRRRFPDRLG